MGSPRLQSPGLLDRLDEKANETFPGLVVRKDLVRRLRSAYGVPIFVIEYLLGKYCASTDPTVIEHGLEFVRKSLSERYVKPDEREIVKARIQQQGVYAIIDKVSATLKEVDDKYWATLHNISLDYVNIEESTIRQHDLLLRSLGLEPAHEYFTPRRKLLYLSRLIPLVERNFNLIELGPGGTGKSFVYQQISPYCHLVSSGQTTVAQMFVNLATGQRGLVALWDTVAFDEAAGIWLHDKNGINIMKNYMEDGAFSRGREVINAEGSIVFVGNLDGDVNTIVRTSNLFYPMPKEMDTAFFDRIHLYLPGWELGKTRDEYYTSHLGLLSDYLAELFRALRRTSYVDLPKRYFEFGSHVGGRDAKAVRKTVSGLMKLIHPDGNVAKEELSEYLQFALEMRRRVKEQLKKMGGLEYWDVNFSYIDRETGAQTYVTVPESGGGVMITGQPLPAGSVYTIGMDTTGDRRAGSPDSVAGPDTAYHTTDTRTLGYRWCRRVGQPWPSLPPSVSLRSRRWRWASVHLKRYDSVPVSMMCARSVMRSRSALHRRPLGMTRVHSEKAASRSARPARAPSAPAPSGSA